MSGLHINGVLYPVEGIVGKAKLGDVLDLQTATKGELKVTPKTINNCLPRLPELLSIDGELTFDLLEDTELLANLIGLVFLTRRAAGENVSYEDARQTDFAGVKFDFDEAEPEPPKGGADTSAEQSNQT